MFQHKDKKNKPDTSAERPERSAITNLLRHMRGTDEVDEKQDINRTDRLMYELRSMPHWKQVREYIERRVGDLQELRDADFSSVGLEEIGLRFLVANLAVKELQRIVDMVETRADAIEQMRSDSKE